MKKPTTYAFVFCQILGLLALQAIAAAKAKTQSGAEETTRGHDAGFPPIGVVKDGNVPNDQKIAPSK